MIGIPTGRKSGIDVLDLDLKPNEYIDGFEHVPQWKQLSAVIVKTPSKGAHVLHGNRQAAQLHRPERARRRYPWRRGLRDRAAVPQSQYRLSVVRCNVQPLHRYS
jgi:hypothetical protein